MTGTMGSDSISTKQGEIAALAGIEPRRVLTTMGVAEIAVRSGYANASAFTRAFRREYGRAPRFLREA